MKLFFVIFGLLAGAIIDGFFGAILGLIFGVIMALIVGRKGGTNHPVAEAPPTSTLKLDQLAERITQLERQVKRLEAALEAIEPGALQPASSKAQATPRPPSYVITAGAAQVAAPPPAAPQPPIPTPTAAPAVMSVKPLRPALGGELDPASSTLPLVSPLLAPEPAPQSNLPADASAPAKTAEAVPTHGDAPPVEAASNETTAPETTAPDLPAETPPEAEAPTASTAERTLENPWDMFRQPPPVRPLRQPPIDEPPSPAGAFLRRLIFGGNTIVKAGVLILFLGLAFLLRYVAGQVTVPIEARYAGVALLGVILLGLGWRLRDREDAGGGRDYGVVLQGGGVGVLYLTTLAAMKLNPLLPTALGFGLMVALAGLCALLAVAQNAPWMAYVATAAGFATPILVSTGESRPIALFSYLAILDMGIVLMAWFKAWRPLNLVGFIGTFTLASGWSSTSYTPDQYPVCQGFLLLFFLMFTAISVLFARRALAQGDPPDTAQPLGSQAWHALRAVGRVDSSLVFGVPLTAFGLQYSMVQADRWLPALSAGVLAAFYLLLCRTLWGREGEARRYSLLAEAYGVVGALFATLAVPLALDSTWTSATWAVEAASMYWLGTRQHRTYSRAFGMVMLCVAAARTLIALQIRTEPHTPLLQGSLMGLLLLAGSAFAVAWIHRRATQTRVDATASAPWESTAADVSGWLAAGALTLVPWMLLVPLWASVVTAGLALVVHQTATRLKDTSLAWCARVQQLATLVGFASTLHIRPDAAMLDNGWQGLLAAVLIGLALLAQIVPALRQSWQRSLDAAHAHETIEWSLPTSVGLITSVTLLSASLLFAMPLEVATLVWPVLALPALFFGLRMAFPALCWIWLGLTLSSAAALLALGPPVTTMHAVPAASAWQPLGGLGACNALLLAACALVSGLMLQGDVLRARRSEGRHLSWVMQPGTQVMSVLWILGWWCLASVPEIIRHLRYGNAEHAASLPAWLVLWSAFTGVVMHWLAARKDWSAMGQAAVLPWPVWLVMALAGWTNQAGPVSDHLGWLAWPVALMTHAWLLRGAQAWWPQTVMRAAHLFGYWLFSALAVSEVWWFVGQTTSGESAWRDLGWLLPPLLLVGLSSLDRWTSAGPMKADPAAYRLIGPIPYAILLALWLAWSLVQPGDAAPLPYIPLINPLEIGQGLTALVLLAWVRNRVRSPATPFAGILARQNLLPLAAGAAFIMVTTMVLRTCHQWADVEWAAQALWASRLTQAAVSIAWALLGVGLMLLGHHRVRRTVWVAGAILLGVVVAKLFLVELADKGGLWRIVSFIVVGVLLLLVGYFAPVPPARRAPRDEADGAAASQDPLPASESQKDLT